MMLWLAEACQSASAEQELAVLPQRKMPVMYQPLGKLSLC
jgi:hypothetical protein